MGETNISYLKWYPILQGITTLEEVNRSWTINDLADAHEALNIQAEMDSYYERAYQKLHRKK